jgi:RNA polymerase sigma-70 factor (ECF subfamily)
MTVPSPAAPAPSPETCWRSAWERHGEELYGFLRRRTGRREDAEDLLQETFARAIRARPEGLPDEALRPYLFTAAQHLLADRRERGGERLFSEMGTSGADPDPADPRAVSPEDHALGDRLRRRLREVLGRLPQAHRTAYELAVLARMPYEQIRQRTGWSAELVRVNVHRARRRVLTELAPELEGVAS